MDRQLIKSLIDALAASDLSDLEFSQDGATLRLVKRPNGPPAAERAADAAPVRAMTAFEVPRAADVGTASSGEFCAPSYGIVHLRPGPGTPPFVQVGDRVCAGQTLCLMEAMKVFSELRAERDGEILAVLVEPGQEVEAGQALFLLDWAKPADV